MCIRDSAMVGNSVPRHKTITGELRERVFSRILQEEHETGYVDFITLSSSLTVSYTHLHIRITDAAVTVSAKVAQFDERMPPVD